MKLICPLCKDLLSSYEDESDQNEYIDYTCEGDLSHHYSQRIQDNKITIIKVRVSLDNKKLYYKVHFVNNFTEFWKETNSFNRIRINKAIELDLSNVNSLYSKLKTYLVFS